MPSESAASPSDEHRAWRRRRTGPRPSWAQNKFGGAELGDMRRTDRLVQSARLLARHRGESMARGPERRGNVSVDGYYRLIEKAEDGKAKL